MILVNGLLCYTFRFVLKQDYICSTKKYLCNTCAFVVIMLVNYTQII